MEYFYSIRNSYLETSFALWKKIPMFVKNPAVDLYAGFARWRIQYMKYPVRLVFFITNRCTKNCPFCFYSSHINTKPYEELTLSQIQKMAASMPSRIRLLTITGGEPFLRADLPEIISAFDNLNNTQRISIVTNGDLPENAEQSVRKILEDSSVLLTLQVSIQSPSDLVNQSPAAETLKRFITLQKKISRISQVAALTTVGIHNFDRVPELMEMIASNYKILHKIQFLRGIPGNVFPSDPDVLSDLTPENFQAQELNTEDQKKTAKMVRERLTFSENPLMDRIMLEHLELAIRIRELRKPVFPCLAGKADAVIFEDGRISVCENFKPFAGLKDFQMNFRALWDSPEAEKHRKLVHGCACTHPCNIVTSISYDKNSLKKILL